MQGMMQGMMNGMQNNQAASPRIKSSAEIAAEQAEVARLEEARLARQKEIEEKKKAKVERLDREAFEMMSLLDTPFNQSKPVTTDFKSPATCTDQDAGERLICHVPYCGGSLNGASVCCPSGYPKLTSDCKCFADDAHFEAMSYSKCSLPAVMTPNAPAGGN